MQVALHSGHRCRCRLKQSYFPLDQVDYASLSGFLVSYNSLNVVLNMLVPPSSLVAGQPLVTMRFDQPVAQYALLACATMRVKMMILRSTCPGQQGSEIYSR